LYRYSTPFWSGFDFWIARTVVPATNDGVDTLLPEQPARMNIGDDPANSSVSAYKLGWFAAPDPGSRPAVRADGSASRLHRHPVLVEVGISSFPVKAGLHTLTPPDP
jgi:hypothetical protein